MARKKKQLRVRLVKSPFGRLKRHQATVRGLGLRRINSEVVLADTPEVRGMINHISYLLDVTEV
ncbi:MAG: 50S ribosomal protein L30 [Gammaproteobacteria bacterium]|nr:50S ribosomal protein L30 [Gammaproteobacteria bacterium]MXX95709.1 50S ribosomal protein L30 [Gammaproteobacteria bacterium]MYF53326.1 50S ribosomal protein L30 [Gammaproteobacteria bacterium]MYK44454.1 50S ribosomal protein L30 [Gammaproteobacteria bacterium]